MCIGVPAKIVKLYDLEAIVEIEGIKKRISVELVQDVQEGDYILLHSGCAIQKLDKEGAIRTLKIIKELAKQDFGDE